MPAYRALQERLLQLGWRMNGGRAATPSLNANIEVAALGGSKKWPITLHTDEQRGLRLNLRFNDFVATPELAERLAEAVEDAVPGLLDLDRLQEVGYAAQPRVPFAQLNPQRAVALVDAMTAALAS